MPENLFLEPQKSCRNLRIWQLPQTQVCSIGLAGCYLPVKTPATWVLDGA